MTRIPPWAWWLLAGALSGVLAVAIVQGWDVLLPVLALGAGGTAAALSRPRRDEPPPPDASEALEELARQERARTRERAEAEVAEALEEDDPAEAIAELGRVRRRGRRR